jgi:hypothetical protein
VVPTIFTRFAQLMTRMVRLFAFAPMMLDGFVKTMVSLGDPLLAFVGARTRSAAEEQESRQRRTGQRDLSCFDNSRLALCLRPVSPLLSRDT